MAKKYVPSGYQIIDIGNIELGNYNLGVNEGLDEIADWIKSGLKKPLLLKGVIDSMFYMGFVTVYKDPTDLSFVRLILLESIKECKGIHIDVDLTVATDNFAISEEIYTGE